MQIGRYRVLGELGRGAMGIVYRAQDPTIGRVIAIKSIRLNELTDAEERARLRERLFREAQSAGILSHPNIVTIYDILEEDGLAYIFMEFVNGRPLDEILRAKELPPNHQLIELLAQTGNALDYAHKKGIIHRDVKPANVMVHEESTAKVCDFGIAKITSQSMTQAGVIMGTPSYMSPELIKGEPLTGASDQFALAIMAYEILTGCKPFTADYLPTLFFKVCSDEPAAIHEMNPSLGPLADRAVRKALAKKPDDRYGSCVEFITVLQRALNGTPDWIPKGRAPVTEETTTGSGGRLTPMPAAAPTPDPPAVMRSQQMSPLAPVQSPAQVSLPPVAHQTQATVVAPVAPVQEPTVPSMRIPIREMEERQAPVSAPPPKAILAAAAVAVLAAAAYFGYSQLSKPAASVEPQPVGAANRTPSKPPAAAKPVATKGPDQKKKEIASTAPPNPVPVPVAVVTKPAGTVAPPASKEFEIAFATSPSGAMVIVDGSLNCTSPCPLKLAVGRHRVQLTLAGYLTTHRAIEVPQVLDLFVTLPESTGILSVLSTPAGATIIVDGQTRPEKTPAKLTLREGAHKIDIVSGALRDSHDVNIKQGGIHQVQTQW